MDINGRPFVIAGVLREFIGLDDWPRDVWLPLPAYAALAAPDLIGANQPRAIEVSTRLRPGVTAAQAQSAITAMMAVMVDRKDDVRAEVSLQTSSNPLSLRLLALLAPVFVAFGLVLVTACATCPNVMLAPRRAAREIGSPLARRECGRVFRQLLSRGLIAGLRPRRSGAGRLPCFASPLEFSARCRVGRRHRRVFPSNPHRYFFLRSARPLRDRLSPLCLRCSRRGCR